MYCTLMLSSQYISMFLYRQTPSSFSPFIWSATSFIVTLFFFLFFCAEKVQLKGDLDIQRKKEELDKKIEMVSQQCAMTDKKSPMVRHHYTASIPKIYNLSPS